MGDTGGLGRVKGQNGKRGGETLGLLSEERRQDGEE